VLIEPKFWFRRRITGEKPEKYACLTPGFSPGKSGIQNQPALAEKPGEVNLGELSDLPVFNNGRLRISMY
jgi:hypothetical protein